MNTKLSKRLTAVVEALPLQEGIRVLEIGCGPGAMAREMARRIGKGHVLAIDRSAKAIRQATAGSQAQIQSGSLSFRQVAIEDLTLEADQQPFDIAVAIRVGALDGRHLETEKQALQKIAKALQAHGRLFVDRGNSLQEIRFDPVTREAIHTT
jgi:2-polyprenyl-3-methyl-5-hydroxy-6-metoxy-1,4-benzoquinol methylase